MKRKQPKIDHSASDKKYFDTLGTFNCPYCNRNHIPFIIVGNYAFDWTSQKKCYSYLVQCTACLKTSLHHSWKELKFSKLMAGRHMFHSNEQLDDLFFHSIPTSFFVQDERIPKILRELIFEAEGCLKMNFLTGASVCARKAIYEFTIIEQAQGENYDERIKFLKVKFSDVDSRYFDVLCHIKDMTSDKVHEQSWDKWDTKHIQLLLEVMRSIFNDIYVAPKEKEERSKAVTTLLEGVRKGKQASPNTGNQAQRTR